MNRWTDGGEMDGWMDESLMLDRWMVGWMLDRWMDDVR